VKLFTVCGKRSVSKEKVSAKSWPIEISLRRKAWIMLQIRKELLGRKKEAAF